MLKFVESHMNQNKDGNTLSRVRSTEGKSSLKYFYFTKCTVLFSSHAMSKKQPLLW